MATRDILRPVLPSLFSLEEPESALMQESQVAFDPFTVTIGLREARWSDGTPITSNDVRFTWEKLRAGPTGYRYRSLRDVEALRPRTVRLRFDRVMRRWRSLFSDDDMILPAHAYTKEWHRRPAVTGGPFLIKKWIDGLKVELRRNDRYWGPSPQLAGIDLLFVPDVETRLQLLERDKLDVLFAEGETNLGRRAKAYGVPPTAGPLSGRAGASGVWGPTWWELNLHPFRIRLPVAKAAIEVVDTALAAEILEDSGRPMDAIPADFTADAVTPGPWSGRGSVEEAKRALDAGGVPAGEERAEFQLAFATGPTSRALAQFIHFRLREIGLTAELVGLEPDSFERSWVPERRAQTFLRLRRGTDAPDVASYASSANLPGSSRIDEQVTAALTATPTELADAPPVAGISAEPWTVAQQRLVDAGTVAPLAQVRTWLIGRDGVWGPRATGAAPGPLWNAQTWSLSRS